MNTDNRIVNQSALILWVLAFLIAGLASISMGLSPGSGFIEDMLRYIIPLGATAIAGVLALGKWRESKKKKREVDARALDASRVLSIGTGCVSAMIFALGVLATQHINALHMGLLGASTSLLALGCYSQLECSQELSAEAAKEAAMEQTTNLVNKVSPLLTGSGASQTSGDTTATTSASTPTAGPGVSVILGLCVGLGFVLGRRRRS